ncbi:MAG: hypothetical protein BWY66_02520 [bacterium ADurb.Bin374]|nr:MAG: hypothetical protein BWY66_02520 [bacterium ADurb.Bin374]
MPLFAGIALFCLTLLAITAETAWAGYPSGITVDGRPGLLTMAVPVGTLTRKLEYTLRYGLGEGDVSIRGRDVTEKKDEIWLSANARLHPHVLFVATYLSTSRATTPSISGIDGITGVLAGGFHVEVPENNMAFGGSYADLSAANMQHLDLAQLEHLRHVYITVTDKIYQDIQGYLQVKQALSQKYTAVFPDGRRKNIPMKRAIIGTLGAERAMKRGASLFGEAQIFDDSDFLYYGSDHYAVNLGYRMKRSRYSVEMAVRSINNSPTWYIGAAASR